MEIPNIDLPVIAESVPVEKAIAVETPKEFYLWDFNNPPWESPEVYEADDDAINYDKEDLAELQPEDYTKY
jgi:hypothetical protein